MTPEKIVELQHRVARIKLQLQWANGEWADELHRDLKAYEAELAAVRMTRQEAYDAGLYVVPAALFSVPTSAWSKEDWMRSVRYTVPVTD